MKANRTCIVLIMLFCANVLFAQRKEAVSISLDEIKDMPQKIITAYFKPVYTTSGVSYPLMQWYAYENKIDTWDKDALNKFNASIYGFKEEPIKAAEFALQFCRSFGEKDFIDNFKAIGFNSVEINSILLEGAQFAVCPIICGSNGLDSKKKKERFMDEASRFRFVC